ncbi:integration host factor subunit beta [Acidihalobacter yilgarnensis]|uniref:Integration host factor subunit beta n=1 Tax=Acidihalobacter yilgarnensis TaxID=2819280 RepID=A0A1D8IMY5_9GAMM|nr:integration host factor subunit beta [Acidihalobacter yilgarnensis]AOU97781.1 integration host factor subunit beta [Acidihalobacter yilgarnensis]
MTRAELISVIAKKHEYLKNTNDVDLAVKCLLEQMSAALESGDRIEIRGFGSFSVRYNLPRIGRNPRDGSEVSVPGKHAPHFKPGKELRDRVNYM